MEQLVTGEYCCSRKTSFKLYQIAVRVQTRSYDYENRLGGSDMEAEVEFFWSYGRVCKSIVSPSRARGAAAHSSSASACY